MQVVWEWCELYRAEPPSPPGRNRDGYNSGGVAAVGVVENEPLGLGGWLPGGGAPKPTVASQVRAPAGMIALGDGFDRSLVASLDGFIDTGGYIYPDVSVANNFAPWLPTPPKSSRAF